MSGFDITPQVPAGRKIVQAYGDGGFRVSGERIDGSLIIWPEGTVPWSAGAIGDISAETLSGVLEIAETIDLLLIGCGAEFGPEPTGVRRWLKEAGIGLEWMDTGGACRTYNVLAGEDRRIAAALIAV